MLRSELYTCGFPSLTWRTITWRARWRPCPFSSPSFDTRCRTARRFWYRAWQKPWPRNSDPPTCRHRTACIPSPNLPSSGSPAISTFTAVQEIKRQIKRIYFEFLVSSAHHDLGRQFACLYRQRPAAQFQMPLGKDLLNRPHSASRPIIS